MVVTNSKSEESLEQQNETVKQVSDIIGTWGRWQTNIALCVISVAAFSAYNGLSGAFYAPTIQFKCAVNDTRRTYTTTNSSSVNQNSTFEFDNSCSANRTCDEWLYDKSTFDSTIIDEWDLVCDRSWLASLSQSAYMAGIMVSAPTFGHFSDKYGRKPMLWIAFTIEILAGLLSSFSPNVTVFIISRFLLAVGCYGRNLTGFLLAIECAGTKYRAVLGIAVQLGWAFGYITLPGIAYLTTKFRIIILCTTLPEIIWMLWLCYIPESPRWQLTHGRFNEAETAIKRALKLNGKSSQHFEEKIFMLRECIEKERAAVGGFKSRNFFDLWKTSSLRKYSLVLYFTWFVNAFVYYGISLNIGDLGGDLYWNFFFAGLVEFPSYFFTMFIMKYVGRRPLLAGNMYGAGLACLAIVAIKVFAGDEDYQIAILVFAMIGKFCITSSFGIIYVYSAEIYPTVLRQLGVGSCSVAGRVGSIMAPFVKELTIYTSFGLVMAIFGILSILNGITCVFLPETQGRDIPDTLEDIEKLESTTSER